MLGFVKCTLVKLAYIINITLAVARGQSKNYRINNFIFKRKIQKILFKLKVRCEPHYIIKINFYFSKVVSDEGVLSYLIVKIFEFCFSRFGNPSTKDSSTKKT